MVCDYGRLHFNLRASHPFSYETFPVLVQDTSIGTMPITASCATVFPRVSSRATINVATIDATRTLNWGSSRSTPWMHAAILFRHEVLGRVPWKRTFFVCPQ